MRLFQRMAARGFFFERKPQGSHHYGNTLSPGKTAFFTKKIAIKTLRHKNIAVHFFYGGITGDYLKNTK